MGNTSAVPLSLPVSPPPHTLPPDLGAQQGLQPGLCGPRVDKCRGISGSTWGPRPGWHPLGGSQRGSPLSLGEGGGGSGGGVTCICRRCHHAGFVQNSRANALAAGGRLLLSPNSSTQSIINTSPKARCRHYRGSASHSGHHLLSRLQKLGK